MKDIKLFGEPLDANKYFNLVSSYLDLVISKRRSNFSRIELIQYINENSSKENIIYLVNFSTTLLVRDFYFKQATKLQRELIQNFFVKDHIEPKSGVATPAEDTLSMTLFSGQLAQQKEHLENLFLRLEQDKPNLSNDSFSTLLDKLDKVIKDNEVKENIHSLEESIQVNAWYKYAFSIYQANSQIVQEYNNTRNKIRKFLNDFSEVRINLRRSREEFLFEVSSVFENAFRPDELKVFALTSTQSDDRVSVENKPDLKFDVLNKQCPIFFSLLENASRDGSYPIKNGIDQAENKVTLKTSEIIRQLTKEIDVLKLSFKQDGEKLTAELSELIRLFDVINTTLIPVTKQYFERFFSLVQQVCPKNLKHSLNSSEVTSAIIEKSELLQELRDIDIYLDDIKNISEELKKHLTQVESTYHNQYDYYKYALEQEPKQITKLLLFLTVGWAYLYKDVYSQQWRKVLEPIEKHYYFLEAKYKNSQAFWQCNHDHLLAMRDRKKVVLSRLDKVREYLHINQNNEAIPSELLQKKNVLINLLNSSRMILDEPIKDSLLSVEQFTSSIAMIERVG